VSLFCTQFLCLAVLFGLRGQMCSSGEGASVASDAARARVLACTIYQYPGPKGSLKGPKHPLIDGVSSQKAFIGLVPAKVMNLQRRK
jgi:hypothetical protein